jgi:hypothetical protein
MTKHASISPEEAADRLAIRELVGPTHTPPIVAMQKVKWLSSPRTLISWCT